VRRLLQTGLLLILVLPLGAQEIYPGSTISLVPSFYSGYLFPAGDDKSGGGIETGLSLVDLVPRVSMGLTAGYGFLRTPPSGTLNFPSLGLTGGYRFPLGEYFSISPGGGIAFFLPVDNTGAVSMTAALSAGASFEMHLYKRNYLSLKTEFILPFSSALPAAISVRLGVKHSIPIKIPVPPVTLTLSVEPELFSPDGDGAGDVLEIIPDVGNPASAEEWRLDIYDAKGGLIHSREGRGAPPSSLRWDGVSDSRILVSSAEDFTLRFTVVDLLGNRLSREGQFTTDVFVFRDEDKLKIRVPGILFSPGSSDFSMLTPQEAEENRIIIGKVADLLRKFPEYRVLIEGHGNLINWSSESLAAEEERDILLPLSRMRAAAVRELLIGEGIPGDRLEAAGRGGESPLVPFQDEQNRWRNRRVEFILLK